jgi:hypothetical protein
MYNYRKEIWLKAEDFPRHCIAPMHAFARRHDVRLKVGKRDIQPELGGRYHVAILKIAAKRPEVAEIIWDHFRMHHFPDADIRYEEKVFHSTYHLTLWFN